MTIKAAAAVLTAALVLTGCEDDDDVFEPDDNQFATVAGDFDATSFAFTDPSNATVREDFVAGGGDFRLNLGNDGRFFTEFRALATDPPAERAGTFALEGDRITFNDDPFVDDDTVNEREFVFTRNGNTLTLTDEGAQFDFNDDDVMEDARFRGEFLAR